MTCRCRLATGRGARSWPGLRDAGYEEAGHSYDLSSLQAELGLSPHTQSQDFPDVLRQRGALPSWRHPSSDETRLQRDIHELLGIHDNPVPRRRQPQTQQQPGFPQYSSPPQVGGPHMSQRATEQVWFSDRLDAADQGQPQIRRWTSGKRRRSDLLGRYGKDFEIPQDVKEEPEGLMGEDPEWTPDQEDSPRVQPRANRWAKAFGPKLSDLVSIL